MRKVTRKFISDLLETVAPTFPIGMHDKKTNGKRYLVLRRKMQQNSLTNAKGAWLYYEVLAYVPGTSILGSDELVDEVTAVLKSVYQIEVTGGIQGDYFDPTSNCYMQTIEFRVPNTI